MNEEEYIQMRNNLREAIRRYPNCRIANCECDEYNGEWKKGCHCMGHFKMMDRMFGEKKWGLNDFDEMAHKGMSPEEYEKIIKIGR